MPSRKCNGLEGNTNNTHKDLRDTPDNISMLCGTVVQGYHLTRIMQVIPAATITIDFVAASA